MARKKIEPIIHLGREDKLTVQKSLPLFELWRSDLTLAEFKILDIYLSRINSHNPEKRAVMFEKGELEKILGVKKINNQDLAIRLKHLMGNVIEIPDESMKKGFRLITLFEEAVAEQDDYGVWQVKLECTQKAMKYFFNIEDLGYLRYKLRCITSLTSRYTYLMFVYLEANRYRGIWNVSLGELKQFLDCDNVETYTAFKEFNKQVLKRVHKEMHEKTECRYSYEPVKKGRSVVAVHFEVAKRLKASLEDTDEIHITMEQWQKAIETDKEKDLWQEPLEAYNLTQEQYDVLWSLLITIPDDRLPQSPACYGVLALMRYHYVDQKVKEIKARGNIKNPYNYLVKIMKNDM